MIHTCEDCQNVRTGPDGTGFITPCLEGWYPKRFDGKHRRKCEEFVPATLSQSEEL